MHYILQILLLQYILRWETWLHWGYISWTSACSIHLIPPWPPSCGAIRRKLTELRKSDAGGCDRCDQWSDLGMSQKFRTPKYWFFSARYTKFGIHRTDRNWWSKECAICGSISILGPSPMKEVTGKYTFGKMVWDTGKSISKYFAHWEWGVIIWWWFIIGVCGN